MSIVTNKMITLCALNLGLFIALLTNFRDIVCETITITIDCNGEPSWRNTEINSQFMDLEAFSNLTVHCSNVRRDISFIIFQVHSYRYDVVLYQNVIEPNTSLVGTNIGMYSRNDIDSIHNFSVSNFNNVTVKTYISIHAYNESAPIPGGCNLVSAVDVDPTLNVTIHQMDTLIRVLVDPAKIDDARKCGDEKMNDMNLFLRHDYYRMYMSERCYDEVEYFDSIRKMMTIEGIEENGDNMPYMQVNNSELLRLFSAYPGTGSVYVVVAVTNFGSAVYVPSHTYGCALENGEEECNIFSDVFTQVVCALMLFAGLFVCFFGHRCIKTEMFLMGLLAGAIVTYVFISQHTHMDSAALVGGALMSGLFTGAIWWLLWWFYGVPVLSVLLPTILLGFFTSCLVNFAIPDGIQIFTIDASYWCFFFVIMFTVPISIILATLHANILSCAVIGSFAAVYPIDHYVGSNLKYIVINVFRRAVVPEFDYAYIAPPFQWRDTIVLLMWIMLSVTGFLFQKYHNMGRSPFPPPPRNTMPRASIRNDLRVPREENRSRRSSRARRIDERTPLIA